MEIAAGPDCRRGRRSRAHCVLSRLRTEAGFPHEVGLFLGYLPADADGFMRRKDECKLCGL
ncbi:MAG: DUF3793 family protein [Clostridia bacterium]|nr:DUF3793 family protein [Clostridia bacterium]